LNRALHLAAFGVAISILLFAGLELFATASTTFAGLVGNDLDAYLAATRRWLATGTPYVPAEVAGPFEYGPDTFLHPPITLLLLAPFLVLPAFLWWAIPIAITTWVVASFRPVPLAWPVMAALIALPFRIPIFVVGNTDLWVCAFVALGLRFDWPGVFIAIKPSLFPLGLVGIQSRSWWITAAATIAVSALFGTLWIDWALVVLHAPGGLVYSLPSIPTLAIPIVAFLSAPAEGFPVAAPSPAVTRATVQLRVAKGLAYRAASMMPTPRLP
jgi:hypothetical protein